MIFWAFTALIVVGWLFFTVNNWFDDWVLGVGTLILGVMLAAIFWVLVCVLGIGMGLAHLLGPNHAESHTAKLKALGSDSSVEGRFYFLSGGYAKGKRVLSYVAENADGSFTPDQVDSSASKVWENDEDDPSMTTHVSYSDRWWLAPGLIELSSAYEFTIPAGSVVESYEVSPQVVPDLSLASVSTLAQLQHYLFQPSAGLYGMYGGRARPNGLPGYPDAARLADGFTTWILRTTYSNGRGYLDWSGALRLVGNTIGSGLRLATLGMTHLR